MQKKTYQLLPKLDTGLNGILANPNQANNMLGYDPRTKQVPVRIEVLANQIPAFQEGIKHLTGEFYTGTVSLDYLTELANRNDITMIYATPKSQSKL